MSVLVLAEHDGSTLFGATHCTVTAARKINSQVDVLVAGKSVDSVAAEVAKIDGVRRVLKADATHLAEPTAEGIADLVKTLCTERSHVLMANTAQGKSAAPRLAAMIDATQISEIVAVVDADTFIRPIYAGNAMATVECKDPIKVITVRTTSFERAASGNGNATIESVAVPSDPGLSKVVSRESVKSDRPELTAARVVISGGRGLGSGENFGKLLEPLANALSAALGASRAAVDAGYVPNDYQVGQTGKIVAPDLYIAIGISGAIQHLAGMKESKVIVAINKDPEAPIFQMADYGLVGDLFELVPQLTAEIARTASA